MLSQALRAIFEAMLEIIKVVISQDHQFSGRTQSSFENLINQLVE